MAKKKKGGSNAQVANLVLSEASSSQRVNIHTFVVIPAVAAGRHPWFYLEDGNVVLKVGYPEYHPLFQSLTWNVGRPKLSSSRFTDISSLSTHQDSKINVPQGKVLAMTTLSCLTTMTQGISAVYCSYFITSNWIIRTRWSDIHSMHIGLLDAQSC